MQVLVMAAQTPTVDPGRHGELVHDPLPNRWDQGVARAQNPVQRLGAQMVLAVGQQGGAAEWVAEEWVTVGWVPVEWVQQGLQQVRDPERRLYPPALPGTPRKRTVGSRGGAAPAPPGGQIYGT